LKVRRVSFKRLTSRRQKKILFSTAALGEISNMASAAKLLKRNQSFLREKKHEKYKLFSLPCQTQFFAQF
jgi:hypothetical protein